MGACHPRYRPNRSEKAKLLTHNLMKKTKPKKAAVSGNADALAHAITAFINDGKHPRNPASVAFLAIEDAANKLEDVLNDRKLTAEQKVALTRKYLGLIQEVVIDATSFKFQLTK